MLSGLVRHVESERCDERLRRGCALAKMLHFVHVRLSRECYTEVMKSDKGLLV